MSAALLIGKEPPCPLGYTYVTDNYDAIVIGSLTLGQLLRFDNEAVLTFYFIPRVCRRRRATVPYPRPLPGQSGSCKAGV